jgi:HSP20 family protein
MAQEINKAEGASTPGPRSTDPFSAMRAEMNRLFDTFVGRGFGDLPALSQVGWGKMMAPSIDLSENDKEFVVEAELPGMDEKDVSVTLSNGVLTLKGEKKSEREEKKDDYHLMERSYGSFHRSFQLGDAVDPDKVSATFDKCVLKVTLAKRVEAAMAEKRIPIGKG